MTCIIFAGVILIAAFAYALWWVWRLPSEIDEEGREA